MYFQYSLENDGHIITDDGKKALARLQVKTEKLVKYTHHVEFFSGIQVAVKSDALWSAKRFQIFNESKELVGSVAPQPDNPKVLWLEMTDKLLLKHRYSFQAERDKWNKNLVIRNESGKVIAQFMRKFVLSKMRNTLFIVEEDLDKLIFEDRLFIYALGHVSRRLLG